ncbi:PD-(D/E)XK motif protein [Planctomyces sp. SH-PL62]|uniref:PD-(D/E)XK motif protein n=1 Tax=Planctomyces sp. SH-PL62 TaxID=1636152 RepID=UPI00078EA1B4|nr:PD-(D/E)XK motif protein [Planctomyces sp. SH-PL62]AMV40489.1 hypothetical protein VT85_23870 [Planctomyces sp. SH-PL62]
MSLETLWQEISNDPARPEAGYLSRRVGIDSPCDMRAAIEFPAGNRVLLVGVPSGPLARAGKLPRSAGIEVSQISMAKPRAGQATVAVRLIESRYADIYTVVCEDLARHLGRAADGPAAAEALVARLRKWQQFLDRTAPEGLAPPARQGLFGELKFLQTLLGSSIDARVAVDAWRGPLAADQDFQFSESSVEVKSTTAKFHQVLEIASERQLDAEGLLFVLHLSLEERPSGAETLPALVAAVRASLAGEALPSESFESRLIDAGYLDAHSPQYLETGYAIRAANYFQVAGDFPRIVEAGLKVGVGAVRYSISVAECMRHRVDEATVIGTITGAGP